MIDEYGSNPQDIICCIGPTIRKCHFEVEEDVKEIFYKEFKDLTNIDKCITKQDKKNKYSIDAVEINRQMLLNMGLKQQNIIDSKICSVCSEEKIHSYRVHKEEAGRNVALIYKK